MRSLAVLVTILSVLLGGCAAGTAPTPPDRPYFALPAAEARNFRSLAEKQESLAFTCGETNSCDHVYFTRALLGLYESREVAERYFGKVLTVTPKSQLAAASRAWMQLLQKPAASGSKSWPEAVLIAPASSDTNRLLYQITDRLVRDLLNKEVAIQQLRSMKDRDSLTVEALKKELAEQDKRMEALLSRKDQGKPAVDPTTVPDLQKQLAERDRKIEELSTQLEALKRIDQEMREKVRPTRPPSTAAPGPTPDTVP
jgi:hypothetical protein